MRAINLIIGALALSALVGCNSLSQREDGLPELPKFLMHKALGATYYVDTLYGAGGNVYCVLQNPEYGQRILFDKDKIYASSPLMEIDSISPSTYRISMLARSTNVDFTNPKTLQQLDTVVPSHKEFKRYVKGYEINEPLYAVYGYTVDMPKNEVPEHMQVSCWLAEQLGCSIPAHEKVNIEKLGDVCSEKFFSTLSEEGDEAPEQSADLYSADFYSAYCYMPAKYVTYLCYTYGYLGGAHGMYGIRLATYSFEKNEGVTMDNLFKADTEDDIRQLAYEALAANPKYSSTHNVSTAGQVKTELAAMGIMELPLPQPALLPEGIVFCYQPYEIGPYSDGAYQVTVPWQDAAPYLK